uniref:Secreted protein n=1 Tax=Nelumbo nucifera TaxID=4432 RepID=A0A822YVG1_NELNU|nr:TPA_asm: hypothetical protein HUJ06_007140 [Nelumbo nucifera]DAD36500.1 TPA_asm: hypothetical protein HUJ06_007141 [Nelumbo nucifera]
MQQVSFSICIIFKWLALSGAVSLHPIVRYGELSRIREQCQISQMKCWLVGPRWWGSKRLKVESNTLCSFLRGLESVTGESLETNTRDGKWWQMLYFGRIDSLLQVRCSALEYKTDSINSIDLNLAHTLP